MAASMVEPSPEPRVPRVAHFVFGLKPQTEPFHLIHYLAIESCRRQLGPDTIYLHHRHLPFGLWWDRIRPHLTLVEVDEVPEVTAASYDTRLVPAALRYAHHADFVRLDALIEHGGVYADIDTLFLAPFPDDLFGSAFVIGDEGPQRDELTGELRPSLCNALMLAEPGAAFARAWREQMAAELNGTWSNHSGFLAHRLSRERPHQLRVEPAATFLPVPCSIEGLHDLLESDDLLGDGPPGEAARLADAVSLHLWAHLWWDVGRLDFSPVHAGQITPDWVRSAPTTYARLARPYLPDLDLW
jgi:Glycosyltransferase sugar-binding region containing DXD motif